MNILLITLDQFRGDCLSVAGHPIVRTPNLDRLARDGVRLARHYSQGAPCGPGRASLYTGMYQMNHRVVVNGTPLDARFDNIAHAARRAGYAPTLFGYTDQTVDPRETSGPQDPRFATYEGVLPGFEMGCALQPTDAGAWYAWLAERGHSVSGDWDAMVEGEPGRPADHSLSAFLTDRLIDWLKVQDRPWFAHLSQLRPHPPYAAAGHFATMYDPADMPDPIAPAPAHRLHERLLATPGYAAPREQQAMRALKAQYYGMITEVTENVDIMPTVCEAMGLEVPAQCDGAPLTPFLRGESPPWWRGAAHWEFDWRAAQLHNGPHPWPWDRRLETKSLTTLRGEAIGYVHFADGSWLCFDLAADPTWRTLITDPAIVLGQAQAALTWRAQNLDRTLTGLLIDGGGVGRWPPMPKNWGVTADAAK